MFLYHKCYAVTKFDFKIKRDHQKKLYERRAYESVDVGSLS